MLIYFLSEMKKPKKTLLYTEMVGTVQQSFWWSVFPSGFGAKTQGELLNLMLSRRDKVSTLVLFRCLLCLEVDLILGIEDILGASVFRRQIKTVKYCVSPPMLMKISFD